MSTTYTRDQENIYFLNDKNIASSLVDEAIAINAVPALSLFNEKYNDLSTSDKNLSDYITNTVNTRLTGAETSCANLCSEIQTLSASLSSDINSLSGRLSNEITALSESLSDSVENRFVHISGDTVTGTLNVKNLSAENAITANSIYNVKNILGTNTVVQTTDNVIAFNNTNVDTNARDIFAWNGYSNADKQYVITDHGTFNINPENGLAGFRIGEQTLQGILNNYAALSNHSDLSDFTNYGSEYISARVAYKHEIPLSVSELVNDNNYNVSSDFNLTYDTNNHKITFSINGNTNDDLIIDTTDFIKNRILDSAEVTRNREGDLVLRLYWQGISEYTDIKISDLSKIYKAGNGISITDDLSILIDEAVVATVDNLNSTNSKVTVLEGDRTTLSTHLENVQTYVDALSCKDVDNPGIILQLSTDVSAALQSNIKSLKFLGEINILEDGTDLSSYLTTKTAIEQKLLNGTFIHVTTLNSDEPRVEVPYHTVMLGNKQLVLENNDCLIIHGHNGEKYIDVKNLALNDSLFIQRNNVTYKQLVDDFVLLSGGNSSANGHAISGDNDYLGDHRFENIAADVLSAKVETVFESNISALTANNADIDDLRITNNLSVGKTLSVAEEVDFLSSNFTVKDGQVSSKYDVTFDEDLNVSGDVEVASDVNVAGEMTVVSAVTLSDTLTVLSDATFSSDISVAWSKLYDTESQKTLAELSTELSNAISTKIFISSYNDEDAIADYSDLSIIKLGKEEYDQKVASGSPLCGNVLYVVDSDIIDAYGRQISNVSMADDFTAAAAYVGVAATDTFVKKISDDIETYVNTISTALSGEIDDLSAALSGEIDDLSAALSGEIDDLSAASKAYTNDSISNLLSTETLSINQTSELSDIISAVVTIWQKLGGSIKETV